MLWVTHATGQDKVSQICSKNLIRSDASSVRFSQMEFSLCVQVKMVLDLMFGACLAI